MKYIQPPNPRLAPATLTSSSHYKGTILSLTRTHEEISTLTMLALCTGFPMRTALSQDRSHRGPIGSRQSYLSLDTHPALTGIMCDLTNPSQKENSRVFDLQMPISILYIRSEYVCYNRNREHTPS